MFRISLLLMAVFSVQTVMCQDDIIMGTVATVNDIQSSQSGSRYFYDNGGPDGDFGQNRRDTISMRTSVGRTVMYAYFEEFAMSIGDTLWIFDGQDCSAPLIGYYNLVNNPGEVMATGRWMTFVFHSDDQDIPGLMDGWRAMVAAYDTTQHTTLFDGEVHYVFTCNSYFYDSGGEGNIANNNENTSGSAFVEFTAATGTHIRCEFTQFSVNGIMKIYDGQYGNPNTRLIGQFCTSTLDGTTGNKPPLLFSSGNTLSFVYIGAAGDKQKSGWKAEISCVPELFESPDGSACPSITNVPLGSYEDVPNTHDILFDCSKPIILLDAEVVATGPYAYDYTIKSIPFESHIFEFNQGNSIDATEDDKWKSSVQLPFSFSFFGQSYTSVYPGTNGIISFTPRPVGQTCAYAYGIPPTSPPYTTNIQYNQTSGGGSLTVPYNYNNCIYGVYEDIDCRYFNNYSFNQQGDVKVGVLGSEPCRAFVFNYLNVGLFGNHSAASNYNTYQMVIYEGTNIIDVYVKHRACCASTNNHSDCHEGVIGLQNSTSSQILVPNGRNVSANGWEANDEAWRFTPVTTLDPNSTLTWYEGSISPNNIIASGSYTSTRKITVSPQETTKYISVYTFTNAAGATYTLRDTTLIRVNIPSVHATCSNGNTPICPGDASHLTVTPGTEFPNIHPQSYLWSTEDTTATCTVNPTQTKTYSVTVTFDNQCTRTDTVLVMVTNLQLPEIMGDDTICLGQSSTLVATHPTSNIFRWSTGQTTPSITVSPQVTTLYTVSATMEGECVVTDTFSVYVQPLPRPMFLASPTEIYVENGIGTVNCTNLTQGDYNLVWDFGDVLSNTNIVTNVDDPFHDYVRAGYYTITLTATDTLGCADSVKSRVSVTVPYFFYVPNAFTPDGDGINETFAPKGAGVDPDNYSMQIFDRTGMLIYSTRNPFDYWDGRNKYGQMCPEGVYIYIIRLLDLNGDDKEYTGSVTLVR